MHAAIRLCDAGLRVRRALVDEDRNSLWRAAVADDTAAAGSVRKTFPHHRQQTPPHCAMAETDERQLTPGRYAPDAATSLISSSRRRSDASDSPFGFHLVKEGTAVVTPEGFSTRAFDECAANKGDCTLAIDPPKANEPGTP
ncbi:hypothetical protein HPB50_010660 [Hyalomma asiaticum]|uniref:Uncharacterized protein n=1 Tax=Hyalomma asiaticum TaxID=266040 RepID=A0ACB7TG55_HYAAI|nr:hypothetical protein HPB50_010660 [Hyalomma asiaticum]